MALLKATSKDEKKVIRINISKSTADEVEEYIKFAGIKKVEEFFEQAANYILGKDKDWKAEKKNS